MKLKDVLWKTGVYMTLGETDSRHHIDMTLSNTTRERFLVSLPGSLLQPEDPAYQRLFVAGAHGAPSQLAIRAGEARTVRLATLCFDKRLADPVMGLRFEVSREEGPAGLTWAAARWGQARLARCLDDEFLIPKPGVPGLDLKQLQLMAHGKLEIR